MNLKEARNKYRYDLPQSVLNSYKEPDKYLVVNDGDKKLTPIIIEIEKIIQATYKLYNSEYEGIPDWEYMDNFGLPAEEQMYFVHQYPKKLEKLEYSVVRDLESANVDNKYDRITGQKILAEINRRLEYDYVYFKNEIEYIKRMWYNRLYGRWIFINGKPTYIDGWQDFYCSHFYLGSVGYPEYRDVDRRTTLFYRYAYTTTHTFKNVDKDGVAVKNSKGIYEMVDLGHRVCYGVVKPKKRREGATNLAIAIIYEIISRTMGNDVLGGIQADGESTSKSHYITKFLPAWKKMPFFFKPMWAGNNTPMSGIKFTLPVNISIGDELESQINYATTADGSFYDHTKLYAYLGDEWGKVPSIDILENVWGRVKPALAQGAGAKIIGFCIIPSTVEEMEGLNADRYYDLCESSNFYKRIPLSGQTHSGLFRLFVKAWDGLEGFIDEYGASVIEKPTDRQKAYIKRDYGAKEYILSTIKSLEKENTHISRKALRTFKKRFPTNYEECFVGSSGDVGFNTQILDEKLIDLRLHPEKYMIGRLEYVNGEKDSDVVFIEDPSGHWEIDRTFPKELTNRKISKMVYDPLEDKYVKTYSPAPEVVDRCTIGADSFEFSMRSELSLRKDGDKMSDGGIAVLYNRNKQIDTDDKNIEEWETYKFIACYRYRTPKEEDFVEEVIKAATYFGGMIYAERNRSQIVRICRQRGYLGYLKYNYDEVTGKLAEQPGYHLDNDTKRKAFSMLRDYIELRGHCTNLPRILREAVEIKYIEQLKDYDTLSAAIGALLGSLSIHDLIVKKEDEIIERYNLYDFYEIYDRR